MLDLVYRDLQVQPFKYLLFDSVFSHSTQSIILDWLENLNCWHLVETSFYEQYECFIDRIALPSSVAFLNDKNFRMELATRVGGLFGVELSQDSTLTAHRLVPGQHIGIHNDRRSGGESHRLTIQFNRGLRSNDGGFFMLFSSDDPSNIHRVLRPISNTGIAFEISDQSNHAVSAQHSGIRFALIFCFNERPSTEPPANN